MFIPQMRSLETTQACTHMNTQEKDQREEKAGLGRGQRRDKE